MTESVTNFITTVLEDLETLNDSLLKVSFPNKGLDRIEDKLDSIGEVMTEEIVNYAEHKNSNTFWLSLAPIQHWFGDCLEEMEAATGDQESIDQINNQLNTWLKLIEQSIPNFKPDHERIFTILQLAEDGKYYNDQTQDYTTVMPEDWPYRHLYEG